MNNSALNQSRLATLDYRSRWQLKFPFYAVEVPDDHTVPIVGRLRRIRNSHISILAIALDLQVELQLPAELRSAALTRPVEQEHAVLEPATVPN